MNSGSAASTDDSLYPSWQPTGVWRGLFSGYYGDGLRDQGGEGYYWSSTASVTGGAYALYFYDGNVYPVNGSFKGVGYAVRCAI